MPDLEVIYDSGRGVPASPYLAYLVSAVSAADAADTGESVMPGLSFPITSSLVPGVLDHERGVFDARWLAQPVFLVGADARSLHWLTFNRWRLLRLAAWGLAMQADDALAFRAIQLIAPDLKLAPSSGAWLDRHLIDTGVTVYPILIDTDGMARQALTDGRYGPSVPASPKEAGSP